MKAFDKMTEVSPKIRKTGEKSFYIEVAPDVVKYCSDVRLEKLRTRAGKTATSTPEELIAIDAKVVAEYRKRTTASAPNVAVEASAANPTPVVIDNTAPVAAAPAVEVGTPVEAPVAAEAVA